MSHHFDENIMLISSSGNRNRDNDAKLESEIVISHKGLWLTFISISKKVRFRGIKHFQLNHKRLIENFIYSIL